MAYRVLIVEDDQDSGEIVEAMLKLDGLDPDMAATAEEAITMLKANVYDAAVIDLMLPGMDGLDLARNIRNSQTLANLPCIAITAYGSGGLRRQAAEAGYNVYYAKPVAQGDLIGAIHRLLS